MPSSLILMYLLVLRAHTPAGAAPLMLLAVAMGIFTPAIHTTFNHRVSSATHRATLLSIQSVACRGFYALCIVPVGWLLGASSLDTAIVAIIALGCLPLVALAWLVPPRSPATPTE